MKALKRKELMYIFTGICVFRGIFRVMCVFLNMSSFDS